MKFFLVLQCLGVLTGVSVVGWIVKVLSSRKVGKESSLVMSDVLRRLKRLEDENEKLREREQKLPKGSSNWCQQPFNIKDNEWLQHNVKIILGLERRIGNPKLESGNVLSSSIAENLHDLQKTVGNLASRLDKTVNSLSAIADTGGDRLTKLENESRDIDDLESKINNVIYNLGIFRKRSDDCILRVTNLEGVTDRIGRLTDALAIPIPELPPELVDRVARLEGSVCRPACDWDSSDPLIQRVAGQGTALGKLFDKVTEIEKKLEGGEDERYPIRYLKWQIANLAKQLQKARQAIAGLKGIGDEFVFSTAHDQLVNRVEFLEGWYEKLSQHHDADGKNLLKLFQPHLAIISFEDDKKNIAWLEKEIARNRDLYLHSQPEISDAEFDGLKDELARLECPF